MATRNKDADTGSHSKTEPRYLPTPELRLYFGISKPTFERLVLLYDDFPVPVRLSSRLSLWDVSEMAAWLGKRKAESCAAPKGRAGQPVPTLSNIRGELAAKRAAAQAEAAQKRATQPVKQLEAAQKRAAHARACFAQQRAAQTPAAVDDLLDMPPRARGRAAVSTR